MGNPGLSATAAEGQGANTAPLGARISRLRIRHLQLLDQIEKLGSLSAAATAVGVSQPRATNMLRELEEAFGCPLLDRSSRGGRLNAAGAIALERLRIALGALDAAHVALLGRKDRPMVRIGVLPLVGTDRLCKVVADLQTSDALPRLVLRVGTVGELLALLLAGEVDCVLCGLDTGASTLPPGARLQAVNLWEERLLVVAAKDHPLTRRRQVRLAELLQHPWLLMPARSANRQALDRMFLQAGLTPPEPLIETGSPHMGLAFVASSRMLALVPESAYQLAADRVAPIRLSSVFQPSWVNLITLRDVPTLPFVAQLAQRLKPP